MDRPPFLLDAIIGRLTDGLVSVRNLDTERASLQASVTQLESEDRELCCDSRDPASVNLSR